MTAVDAKFVFGVDIDGVVADYTAGFAGFVAACRGVSPDDLPPNRSYGFDEWRAGDEGFDRLHRLAVVEQRMLLRLPMIEGASDALWRLSDAGVWIRVITHRLYFNWSHAVTVTDTVSWLEDKGIPYRDICFLGDKPEVGANLYVDDAPHNITALRASGSEAVVFDQPYNRSVAPPRAVGWKELERLVMARFAAWSA